MIATAAALAAALPPFGACSAALALRNLCQPFLIGIVALFPRAQIDEKKKCHPNQQHNRGAQQEVLRIKAASLVGRVDSLRKGVREKNDFSHDHHAGCAGSSSASLGLWMFNRCIR